MSIHSKMCHKIEMLEEERDQLKDALRDMLSGWRYIREEHGDLYGVGWDRCEEKALSALGELGDDD